MPSIAIIDANALGHVVKHATSDLSFDGDKTGVIYGFLRKLFIIQEKMNADQILFAWDAPKYSLFRAKEYPTYKNKDQKKIQEKDEQLDLIARPQFKILRKEVLPTIGFNNNYILEGFEADDIIAQIVLQYKSQYNFQIVSRDNDLHQLLDSNIVTMFDPIKLGWFTEKIFVDKWGIKPSEWDLVKSIAGCKGDEVEGIKGVKEKTAIKFLKGQLKPTTQAFKRIIEGEDICLRNVRLVKLPYESTPSFEIFIDNLSWERFLSVCKKYNFKSMIGNQTKSQFEHLFMKE
jgi:5'-3' exonuclease